MIGDEATMSLLEHLEELRRRIIVIAIAIALAGIAGFFLADPIIAMIKTALVILAIELIVIGWVRSRYRSRARAKLDGPGQPAVTGV